MACQIVIFLFLMLVNGNVSPCSQEGEPAQVKCPLSLNLTSGNFQNTFALAWYRKSESDGLVRLALEATGRIISKGLSLQFWPSQVNDTGKYICSLMNTFSEELSLWVHRRNEDCHSMCLYKNTGMISKSFRMYCNAVPKYEWHDSVVGPPMWYKGCNFLRKETALYFMELTESDSGNYTCEVALTHAGKNYTIRKTIYLKLEDSPDIIKPRIMGKDMTHHVEVEIGKELRLNCTAFIGYSNNSKDSMLYWFRKENSSDENGDFFDQCDHMSEKVMQCENSSKRVTEGKTYMTRELKFQNVKEEDLTYMYICKLSSTVQNDNRTYILKKKEKIPDIPKHVFTAGMMAAIIFSSLTITVVAICLIFRVDLVLLYRDLTGKDETLADGKEFDAYVSYLNEYMLASEEEREFVLQILPNTLEKHFGYKLCIFERDVTPGGAIVDDIHSFIEKSRRLIIILTRNYMSDKAMYELESGLHIALVEKKIQVILIEHKPLRDFKLMPESLNLLKSKRIVKWKAKKSLPLNSRFWKNIRYLMPAKSAKSRDNIFRNPLSFFQKCIN